MPITTARTPIRASQFPLTRGSQSTRSQGMGAGGCIADANLGNVSIVGTGMQHNPGYAARMFRALYEANVNIEMITTSEIRITCIVAEDRVEDAVRALHRAFQLDQAD